MVGFLHDTWMVFRNISNTLFALALIALALKNLFGDLIALWPILWRFVLALVFVNFSWFAVKVVVDVWTVATNIIYRLPNEFWDRNNVLDTITDIDHRFVISAKSDYQEKLEKAADAAWANKNKPNINNNESSFENLVCIIKNSTWRGDTKTAGSGCDLSEFWASNSTITRENSKTVIYTMPMSKVINDNKKLRSSSIAWSMAINYLPLKEFIKISSWSKDWGTLTFQVVFGIIFSVMSAIVFVAVTITMLQRLIILWLLIMLSPLSALSITAADLWVSWDFTFSSLFWKLANYAIIIPAWIWLVFTLTFIMIGQLYYVDVNAIWDWNIFENMWSAWTMILSFATLWILWIWSFEVMKTSGYISAYLTDKIKSWVETIAEWAWSQLLYLPIIPMWKTIWGKADVSLSLGWLKNMFWKFANPEKAREKSNSNIDFIMKWWGSRKIDVTLQGEIDKQKATPDSELNKVLATIQSSSDLNETKRIEITNAIKQDLPDSLKNIIEWGNQANISASYAVETWTWKKIENVKEIYSKLTWQATSVVKIEFSDFKNQLNDKNWDSKKWWNIENIKSDNIIFQKINSLGLSMSEAIKQLIAIKTADIANTKEEVANALKKS